MLNSVRSMLYICQKNINKLTSKVNIPVVSVVLPFYRPGKKLDKAVQSIVDQDLKDWEMVLVNNNACNISEDIALMGL